MCKKIILTLVISLLALGLPLEAVVRAAMDIGSGGMKVTVADVDTETQKIEKIFYSQEHPVGLKRDMEVGGTQTFSLKAQQRVIDSLRKVQNEVASFEPKEWVGIATAASRQSKNAPEFYQRVRDELGVDIHIIPQEEEGRLGFQTALAVTDIKSKNLVAYDSGGGSFQLTTQIGNKLEVGEGQLGTVPALSALVTEIRGQKLDLATSPNPVSPQEATLLAQKLKTRLPKLSPAFVKKLKAKQTVVVGIGNENFIFAYGAVATGKNIYTKEELWQAIMANCDRTDAELQNFPQPDEAITGNVLLYAVMDGLNIDKLTYAYANGSCEGLLIDQTGNYWKD